MHVKDSINLGLSKLLGNNINRKIEYYLNKIIKLNKQISVFWIWFILAIVLFGILIYIYGINAMSANIDRFINLHNSVNNNIVPTLTQ